jgi:hypothetical protein
MQVTKINVVQNDYGFDLNFTLQDYSGTAVNLSGATILFKAQKENNTSLKFSGSMSVVSAVAGTCKYTVQNGDFSEVGTYSAEIQVTIASQVITWTNIKVSVFAELPK